MLSACLYQCPVWCKVLRVIPTIFCTESCKRWIEFEKTFLSEIPFGGWKVLVTMRAKWGIFRNVFHSKNVNIEEEEEKEVFKGNTIDSNYMEYLAHKNITLKTTLQQETKSALTVLGVTFCMFSAMIDFVLTDEKKNY